MPLAASSRNVYTYNDIVLSPQQVAQVLWQAGMHDLNAIAQLIPIAQRESGGRAGVQGTTQQRGAVSGDMGLFQINWGAHGQNLLNAGIIQNPQQLYDPVINAKAAVYLSGNGNPQRMLQLWGVANGTWAGTGGTLPAPNFGVVQQAQSSGLFNQPYNSSSGSGAGGAGVPPGYGNAPGVPPPNVSTAYYDMLYGNLDAQIGLNQATTQNAVNFQQGQQGFQNQISGLQQQGLDLQGQRYALENKYQNDVALINKGLTDKQIKLNEQQWRHIATNIKSERDLETQVYAATQAWISKQKGFNARDFQLASQAIRNVLTTETARWAEVRRASGAETDLAKQKQSYIEKGAQEAFGQAIGEAAFVEKEQVRKAASEAIAKGARTSKGYGQDIAAFGEQRGLAGSAAQIQRADILRMSQNQLAGELENIRQAYNSGRISFQDAQRQSQNAQARAVLTRDQNLGQLNYDAQQSRYGHRGNQLDFNNQYAMANFDYQGRNASLGAQQQQAGRTQAYNNALYGINQVDLQNTGNIYGTQLAQSQATTGYQVDQALLGGGMGLFDLNNQYAAVQNEEAQNAAASAGQPPSSYYVSPQEQQRRRVLTTDPYRNVTSGVYVPPVSAYN